jgi:hypothetical protein
MRFLRQISAVATALLFVLCCPLFAQTARDSAHAKAVTAALNCSQRRPSVQIQQACAAEAALLVAPKPTPAPTPAPTPTPAPQPAPTPAPTPTPVPSSALASATFEDGTYGPFYNPWGYGTSVIADPTSRATGKVLAIHYQNAPPGDVDANLALAPSNTITVGLSDSLYFAGDFYIDASQDVMRKLTYWSASGCGAQFITTLQPGFGVDSTKLYTDIEGAQSRGNYTGTFAKTHAWHHVVVFIRVNSSTSSADGVSRVWLDGQLADTQTGVQWINTSGCVFNSFGVGYQAQSSAALNEYRYWDNLIFSRSPTP